MDLIIPRTIEFAAGMDWGFHAPHVIVWAALLTSGRMHIVREWKEAGCIDELIAEGYHARTKELGVHVRYVAGDPSMWFQDGRNAARGQSRAESLIRAGMPLRPAANSHEDGWSRMQTWLYVPRDADGAPTGEPMLTIDESCRYLRRTIPAAQSDKTNADDVDRSGDIHGCDAIRYLTMSRPSPTVIRAVERRYHPELEKMLAGASDQRPLGADLVRTR